MNTTYIFLIVLCAISSLLTVRADGPGEVNERLRAPLVNAGVGLDANSLINALEHTNYVIAARAALLLGAVSPTKAVVEALRSSASSEREIVAVSAMRSLLRLKDTNWHALAIERIPKLKDRMQRIELAGILAEVGIGQGWQEVVQAISDPTYCSVALEKVTLFDLKRDGDGNVIHVVKKLEEILNKQLPESSRVLVIEKLRKLHKGLSP